MSDTSSSQVNRPLVQTTVPMFFGGRRLPVPPYKAIGPTAGPDYDPFNYDEAHATQGPSSTSARTRRGVAGFADSGRLSHGSNDTSEASSICLHEIAANYLTHKPEPCGRNCDKCIVFLNHVGPFGNGIVTKQFVAYNLGHKIAELNQFEPVHAFYIQRKWGLQLVGIEKLSPEDGSSKLLK